MKRHRYGPSVRSLLYRAATADDAAAFVRDLLGKEAMAPSRDTRRKWRKALIALAAREEQVHESAIRADRFAFLGV